MDIIIYLIRPNLTNDINFFFDPPSKVSNAPFTQNPYNPNLIKNVEDNVGFFTGNVFIPLLQRNHEWKIKNLNKQKRGYLIRSWSDEACKGSV